MSYDDYNLACIMTLPQYQRMGYGMLMIEFSKSATCRRLSPTSLFKATNSREELGKSGHRNDRCPILA